jgi:hypothetical protein
MAEEDPEIELVMMCARTHSMAFRKTAFFQRRLTNAQRSVNGLFMDFSELKNEECWQPIYIE